MDEHLRWIFMYNNMRLKTLLTFSFLLIIVGANAKSINEKADSIISATITGIKPDTLQEKIENPAKVLVKETIHPQKMRKK